MKGVSAVIATILLLLIVIAIVGFAFGFFQRIFGVSTTAVEQQTGQITTQVSQRVEIDNVQNATLTVRNRGSASVAVSTIAAYVNSAPTSCNWAGKTTLAPNEIASCTLAAGCPSGGVVRVTAAGSDDSRTCP